MTLPSGPGWRPDPTDPDMERLWDGEQWTDNTRPRLSPAPSAQESAAASPPTVPRPKTNMVWAVIAVVLFCIPLGVVGIVYASKVNYLWSTGEYDQARSNAKKSLTWSLIGIGLGVTGYAALLIGVMAGGLGTLSSPITCPQLASEAVRISAENNRGTGYPLLLRVESPTVVSDSQSTAKPPASGELVILRCTGTGYFSSTQTAMVDLMLSLDSDAKQWVAYEAQ